MIPECKASPHGRHFFNFFNDCGGFDKDIEDVEYERE